MQLCRKFGNWFAQLLDSFGATRSCAAGDSADYYYAFFDLQREEKIRIRRHRRQAASGLYRGKRVEGFFSVKMSFISRFGTIEEQQQQQQQVEEQSADFGAKKAARKRQLIDLDKIEVDYSYSDNEDDDLGEERRTEQSFASCEASTAKRQCRSEEKVFRTSAAIRESNFNGVPDDEPRSSAYLSPSQQWPVAARNSTNHQQEHTERTRRSETLAVINRMLNSVRRTCIRFSRERNCFMFKDRSVPSADAHTTVGEKPLIGLRDILRRVCFPNYRYTDTRSAVVAQFESQRIPTGLTSAHHGRARGIDVHEQLATYISKGEVFWRNEYNYGCSPYVERIIAALHIQGLRPIASEFQDFFNNVTIGSSIDIVCEDLLHHGIALIELKIGGENYFEKSTGALLGPRSLTNFNNSPRNQALLQLLAYRAMITTNYPYVPVTRCYVLQARTVDIVFFGLTAEFIRAQNELVAALAGRRRYDISRQRGGAAQRARGWRGGRQTRAPAARWLPQAN